MIWPWSKTVRVQILPRQATKLRLSEWQSDQALTVQAGKALADPTVQLMVAVLQNEHPAFIALPEEVELHERAIVQARSEGYTMALANLEALGQFKKPTVMPEATFEAEEIETK